MKNRKFQYIIEVNGVKHLAVTTNRVTAYKILKERLPYYKFSINDLFETRGFNG